MKIAVSVLIILAVFIFNAFSTSLIGYAPTAAIFLLVVAICLGIRHRQERRKREWYLHIIGDTCAAIEKDLGSIPVNRAPNVIFMYEVMKREIKFAKPVKTK